MADTIIEYKVPDPGIDFAEVFKGSKYRFISQCYNGDGTYGLTFEADALSGDTNEKIGAVRIDAPVVAFKKGRCEDDEIRIIGSGVYGQELISTIKVTKSIENE